MSAVEFVQSTTVGPVLYNEGEIAGFLPEVADQLVASGSAKAVKAAAAPKSDK